MRRTLMLKELRQCSLLCALMLLACVGLAWWLQLNQISYLYEPRVPFMSDVWLMQQQFPVDAITANFLIAGGLLAVVLGLVQSAWEQVGNTWAFLLHRPLSRQSVLASKLAVGAGLLMVSSATPIGVYAVWAAIPGTHPNPFGWWMVAPAVNCWLTLPTIYFAAFQCGLQQSRWHGTRLLPIIAAAGFCFGVSIMPEWWMTGFPLLCALLWLQITAIRHTFLTRDF